MSLISQRKLFYVNSNSRLAGTDSRFTYYLNHHSTDNFDRVAILQATVPFF